MASTLRSGRREDGKGRAPGLGQHVGTGVSTIGPGSQFTGLFDFPMFFSASIYHTQSALHTGDGES